MKKLFILAFGILLFACNKQNDISLFNAELAAVTFNEYNPCIESFEVDPLLVPKAITETLNNKYPTANVVTTKAQNDNGTLFYAVKLDNQKEFLLDVNATVLIENTIESDQSIDVQNLSNTLRSFVASNFPGASIEEATKMNEFGNQYYQISLGQTNQLIFDASENFICASGDFNINDEDEDDEGYGGDEDDEGYGGDDDDE